MASKKLIVRAIDVGYGHVKYTDGYDQDGELRADAFPSQAPVTQGQDLKSEFLQARDTFLVPINGRTFEVGRDVRYALSGRAETEILDKHFSLSDGYKARLFGALNYMLPELPERAIDLLVLGLPLTTYQSHGPELAQRYLGTHVINARTNSSGNECGDRVTIRRCKVFPQPLGSYAAYLEAPLPNHPEIPTALVMDPGYNTVDWFVCEGMIPNQAQSGAVESGMSAVLRAIARSVITASGMASNESAVVRQLDSALLNGTEFRLKGKVIDLTPHMRAGEAVMEQAVCAMYKNVGEGDGIDIIVLTGGGAQMYEPFVRRVYPNHDVYLLSEPSLANARGFHHIGERLLASATRSINRQEAEVAESV